MLGMGFLKLFVDVDLGRAADAFVSTVFLSMAHGPTSKVNCVIYWWVAAVVHMVVLLRPRDCRSWLSQPICLFLHDQTIAYEMALRDAWFPCI